MTNWKDLEQEGHPVPDGSVELFEFLDFRDSARSVGDRLLDDLAEILWRSESVLLTIDAAEDASLNAVRSSVEQMYERVSEMMKEFAS